MSDTPTATQREELAYQHEIASPTWRQLLNAQQLGQAIYYAEPSSTRWQLWNKLSEVELPTGSVAASPYVWYIPRQYLVRAQGQRFVLVNRVTLSARLMFTPVTVDPLKTVAEQPWRTADEDVIYDTYEPIETTVVWYPTQGLDREQTTTGEGNGASTGAHGERDEAGARRPVGDAHANAGAGAEAAAGGAGDAGAPNAGSPGVSNPSRGPGDCGCTSHGGVRTGT